MKIGLLKETKIPEDNRVALTPEQAAELQKQYPDLKIKVQASPTRAFSDKEYAEKGLEVCEDVSDCDLLIGIKEADIDTLLPDKRYLFFGHIAKKQEYNIPLFKLLLELKTTFADYEYLVDAAGQRLVAFGWYAGVVGLYYTLLGWGLRTGKYNLNRPHFGLTIEEIIDNIKAADIGDLKIVVTGNGRVSHGAQHVLEAVGATKLNPEEYLSDAEKTHGLVYCVIDIDKLVAPNDPSKAFDFKDFVNNFQAYHSIFEPYACQSDIMLCCHFWGNGQPVYLEAEDFLKPGFRIKMIGDITCDIMGSVKSTLRPATHAEPFYDYNPRTRSEEKAFSSETNITIEAVDTCPNALPRVTSQYFGERLIECVLNDMLKADNPDASEVFNGAKIIESGELTPKFGYLQEYVNSFMG